MEELFVVCVTALASRLSGCRCISRGSRQYLLKKLKKWKDITILPAT